MKKLVLLLSLLALVACPSGSSPTALDTAVAVAAATSASAAVSAAPAATSARQPFSRRAPVVDSRPVPQPRLGPTPSFAHFAGQSTFVLKPGVAEGGIQYASWTTFMAAAALTPGYKTLLVDNSVAPAHATAGTWNMDNFSLGAVFNSGATLVLDEGSVWTGSTLHVGNSLTLQIAATATTPIVLSSPMILYVESNATILTSTTIPFIRATPASSLLVFLFAGVLGNHSLPVISIDSTATITCFAFDVSQTLGGIGGAGTLQFEPDSSVTFDTIGVGTLVQFDADNSDAVFYNAASVANWNNNAPTNVANALDRIAAKIGPIP